MYIICMYMCVCLYVGSVLSTFMQVPGIKLKPAGLRGKSLYPPSQLASPAGGL